MYIRRIGSEPPYRYRVEYRDAGGKRHGATFTRRSDAKVWGASQEAKVKARRHRAPSESAQTIEKYCERVWWPARSVEKTTTASDRGRLNNHVLPYWGGYAIESPRPSDVQGWLNGLVTGGMGAWSARSCLSLLRSILESARRDGLIVDNPAVGLRLPPKPLGREVFLTRAEVDTIAAEMRPFDAAVCYTAAYTGLRWGELSGMARKSIELERRRVHVVQTLIEINGHRSIKLYPKGHDRRTVPMSRTLQGVLKALIETGPPVDGDDLLFSPKRMFGGHSGSELSRHHWNKLRFYPAVAAALGRNDVKVHDLRHTFASWLVMDGVDLYRVQRLMGHKSIDTTERYAHLAPDAYDRELKALDDDGAY